MPITLTGTYTSTVILSNPATQNPASVTSTGLINVNSPTESAAGMLGTSGTAWTVVNQGTVESVGNQGTGIRLLSGGAVTNSTGTSLIQGSGTGVSIRNSTGTVVNSGSIVSTSTGTSGVGVYLAAGGTVTNNVGATISAVHNAISTRGGPTTIANSGIIQNSGTNSAIYIENGGIVTNTAGAQISSTRTGITFNNTSGTGTSIGNIINSGTIESTATGTRGSGVYLAFGGNITNNAGGTITAVRNAISARGGPTTVTNSGVIENSGTNSAIYIRNGGIVTNTSGATISSARTGIGFNNTSGTGTSVGTVVNAGTILAAPTGTTGSGVYFGHGGVLSNQASGMISARTAVSFHNTAGTVDNLGSIVSTAPTGTTASGTGVYLEFGGTLTNRAGGNITAQRTAVVVGGTTTSSTTPAAITNSGTITGGTGILIRSTNNAVNTIVNFGTITGTEGVAIDLAGGHDRVVIETGSTLNGTVAHFSAGDSFDLPFLAFASGATATLNPGNALRVSVGSASFDIALSPTENFAGEVFQVLADSTGGTLVTLAGHPVSFAPPIPALNGFGAGPAAGGWSNNTLYPRLAADVNGDGRADIVGFGEAGAFTALGQANGTFAPPTLALNGLGASPAAGGWTNNDLYPRLLGDMNGDGRADIVGFGEAGAFTALAQADGTFAAPVQALNAFGASPAAGGWTSNERYPRLLGDVNGDGRADIVAFGEAGAFTALGQADATFAAPVQALNGLGASPAAGGWTSNDRYPRLLGDVNGDGRADIVAFGEAGAFTALGQANGTFAAPILTLNALGASPAAGGWTSNDRYPRLLADANDDGRADIVAFGEAGTFTALAQADGTFAAPTLNLANFGSSSAAGGWTGNTIYPRLAADVNGDHRADIIGFGFSGTFTALSQIG